MVWVRRKRVSELQGAPAIRRIKHYSAESGYVYQYWFCGMRQLEGSTEYVFSLAAGQSEAREIALALDAATVRDWMSANRRELSEPERYGVVKATLFRRFDEAAAPGELRAQSVVTVSDLDEAATFLGLL